MSPPRPHHCPYNPCTRHQTRSKPAEYQRHPLPEVTYLASRSHHASNSSEPIRLELARLSHCPPRGSDFGMPSEGIPNQAGELWLAVAECRADGITELAKCPSPLGDYLDQPAAVVDRPSRASTVAARSLMLSPSAVATARMVLHGGSDYRSRVVGVCRPRCPRLPRGLPL